MIMLVLEHSEQTTNKLWTAVIMGSFGRLRLHDIVWIMDRQDLLGEYYWSAVLVLQGGYHCCWSLPGKVELLTT